MQLSGCMLREGSTSWSLVSSKGSVQVLGWRYLDWLPFLHRMHGWHGLPGCMLQVTGRSSVDLEDLELIDVLLCNITCVLLSKQ